MRSLLRTVPGVLAIVATAAAVGFISNSLRSDGLPLVRKPLSTTRQVASHEQVVQNTPKPPIVSTDQTASTTSTASKEQVKDPGKQPVVTPTDSTAPLKPTKQPTKLPKNPGKKTPEPPKVAQALFTNLKDAKECFDKKSAIFVDARPAEDFQAEHVEGALNLFVEDLDRLYASILGSVPKDRLIVTYCSDAQCEGATKLADALVARGHKRVFILLDGLPGWKNAGYPTTLGKGSGS